MPFTLLLNKSVVLTPLKFFLNPYSLLVDPDKYFLLNENCICFKPDDVPSSKNLNYIFTVTFLSESYMHCICIEQLPNLD